MARRREKSAEGWNVPPEGPAWEESQPRPETSFHLEQVINLRIDWNVRAGVPPVAQSSGRVVLEDTVQ
jgi:hypothetical protein